MRTIPTFLISLTSLSFSYFLDAEEPKTPPKEIINSIAMKLVRIPSGKFIMGSSVADTGVGRYFNRGRAR